MEVTRSRGRRSSSAGPLQRFGAAPFAVAVILLCFVLATPRSGGPDEPSHMVASAALVRGDRTGQLTEAEFDVRVFEVPAMVGFPDPSCWAQQPQVPAGCALGPTSDTGDLPNLTTSYNYPPWAYILPGLASYVPAPEWYTYFARIAMALVPAVLVIAALQRVGRLGRGASAAFLVGLTPIAWFSMSIVNPSAVAIGGGAALWAALLVRRSHPPDLLLLAGWLAVLLPRRDGPIMVTLIVAFACLFLDRRPVDLFRRLDNRIRWAIIASFPISPIVAYLSDQRGLNLLIAVAPLSLLLLDGLMRVWRRAPDTRARALIAAGTTVIVALGAAVAVSSRPGGYDGTTARLIVGNTGRHLQQLVGVLGWLDAPAPTAAVYLFWIVIGALVVLAVIDQPRIAAIVGSALAATIVTAWMLELGQGSTEGTYWQGRYSMPFVIGLPLLLALRTHPEDRATEHGIETGIGTGRPHSIAAGSIVASEQIVRLVSIAIWLIWNSTFVAALHRWGAGIDGPWSPSSWTSWNAPIAPVVLIVVHAVATAALLARLPGDEAGDEEEDEASMAERTADSATGSAR